MGGDACSRRMFKINQVSTQIKARGGKGKEHLVPYKRHAEAARAMFEDADQKRRQAILDYEALLRKQFPNDAPARQQHMDALKVQIKARLTQIWTEWEATRNQFTNTTVGTTEVNDPRGKID